MHESIKNDAHQLIDRLPPDASWEDLQYEIYVRQAIAAGQRDVSEDRVLPADEVRRQFRADIP